MGQSFDGYLRARLRQLALGMRSVPYFGLLAQIAVKVFGLKSLALLQIGAC